MDEQEIQKKFGLRTQYAYLGVVEADEGRSMANGDARYVTVAADFIQALFHGLTG